MGGGAGVTAAAVDMHPPELGVVAGAQAGVVGLRVEDMACAVGLQDLHRLTHPVQPGFVTQAPARTHQAGHARLGAVVVANDLG